MQPAARMDAEFRKKLRASLFGDTASLCIDCGLCTGFCPSSKLTALKTRTLIHRARLGLTDVLHSEELWLCMMCYTCYEHCRSGVKVPEIVVTLRNLAVQNGKVPKRFLNAGTNVLNTGYASPISGYTEKMRRELKLETELINQSALAEIKKILELSGFETLISGASK